MSRLILIWLLMIFATHAQKCVKLRDCAQVLSDFRFKKIEPTYCDEDAEIVVCPSLPQRIEERKCLEYSKAVYQYDRREDELKDKCTTSAIPFVVGGSETGINEYPHQALLGDGEDWFCGGSLVSERFVLTAAHCLIPRPPRRVRLGMHNIDERESYVQEFGVKRSIKHPGYVKPVVYHDIALIELSSEVKLTPYVRPICLPSQKTTLSKLTATGYGTTKYEGPQSKTLQKVELPQTSAIRCAQRYNRFKKELPEGVSKHQLCFGGVKGKDTCQGDSGGPLQTLHLNVYCSYILHGLTSVGLKCGEGIPGLYTNVIEYMPWIKSIIW